MHQQIAAIVADFEAAQQRLHRITAATPDARWAVRNDPDRWSVAECVAHLNLTGRAYVPLLREAIGGARAIGGAAPRRYRRDVAGWLIGIMSGPMLRVGGRKLGRTRTAAAFVPGGELPRETVLAEFEQLQSEQIALTREADGLPIHRVKVTSPFDARVRYNAYAALVLLPRHQHRHLEQAEEVWST
jgi:hypothetical protein